MDCIRQQADGTTTFPQKAKTCQYNIIGLIQTEHLTERGVNGRSRFIVGVGSGGNWDAVEKAWNAGDLTPDDLEDLFLVHVVVEDISGDDTDTWGFPGDDYTIVATPFS
ncbi:hypothetical protein [Actinacidiphila oryziradicis]|uniref:Uncharacterized protein n=1 Tax=Actinacidiphila oryziradicis TaxID=2571141 RepID=A0A4U0S4J4_9ACTN|nr:hypothetical protein [Actinacidiphila oryziradicis]TKA01981.1 hypothetical protein FCI23_39615 [Actinacidiphila oryziradicis]